MQRFPWPSPEGLGTGLSREGVEYLYIFKGFQGCGMRLTDSDRECYGVKIQTLCEVDNRLPGPQNFWKFAPIYETVKNLPCGV